MRGPVDQPDGVGAGAVCVQLGEAEELEALAQPLALELAEEQGIDAEGDRVAAPDHELGDLTAVAAQDRLLVNVEPLDDVIAQVKASARSFTTEKPRSNPPSHAASSVTSGSTMAGRTGSHTPAGRSTCKAVLVGMVTTSHVKRLAWRSWRMRGAKSCECRPVCSILMSGNACVKALRARL